MHPLHGLNILITGASAGIGAALARELARHGANMLLAARRTDRLSKLSMEIGPERVAYIECNVASEDDLRKAVEMMNQRFGPVDVAIANAGFAVGGKMEDLTLADYQRQMDTNVFGVLRTTYAVLADLKKTRGRLAIIGSVNGYLAFPGASAYAMSKFAIRALCESLTHELSTQGVSVTHIAPGFVTSDIREVDNKGDHQPGQAAQSGFRYLEMNTDDAARKIVRAIANRRRESVISGHGKLAVFLARHFPRLVAMAFAWRARRRTKPSTVRIPHADELGESAH